MKKLFLIVLATSLVFGNCKKNEIAVSDVRIEVESQDCCQLFVNIENHKNSTKSIRALTVTFSGTLGSFPRTLNFHDMYYANTAPYISLEPGNKFESICIDIPVSFQGCGYKFDSYTVDLF